MGMEIARILTQKNWAAVNCRHTTPRQAMALESNGGKQFQRVEHLLLVFYVDFPEVTRHSSREWQRRADEISQRHPVYAEFVPIVLPRHAIVIRSVMLCSFIVPHFINRRSQCTMVYPTRYNVSDPNSRCRVQSSFLSSSILTNKAQQLHCTVPCSYAGIRPGSICICNNQFVITSFFHYD